MLSILLPFAVENDPWYMHLGQQHRCWELFNVARTQDLDVLGVPRARRKRRRQSKQVRTSLCPLELDGHSGKTEQTARYMVQNLYISSPMTVWCHSRIIPACLRAHGLIWSVSWGPFFERTCVTLEEQWPGLKPQKERQMGQNLCRDLERGLKSIWTP